LPSAAGLLVRSIRSGSGRIHTTLAVLGSLASLPIARGLGIEARLVLSVQEERRDHSLHPRAALIGAKGPPGEPAQAPAEEWAPSADAPWARWKVRACARTTARRTG